MRLLLPGLIAAFAIVTAAHATPLTLKRVLLSSAGVGYFEYEAEVDGPAELGLDVKLDQVDDVLKSLVVFDDAGGVGAVELPGFDAAHEAFGDVPFGPEGLASPLAFLNSLQGVEVAVEGPRPMVGRLFRAEAVREPPSQPGGAAANRTRVSLLTADGLKQFVLEDSDAVQVRDPVLRGRIAHALAAAQRQTAQDARHITIRSNGAGHRVVRVGLVAVAPLWKASYRLVLPPAGADAAMGRLQGWATLENTTGGDWSGVALAVQYGNPVTFHQAIYRSYFVARPEVPVEVLSRLLPDVDSRARGGLEPAPPPPPPAPAAVGVAPPLMAMKAAPGLPMARPEQAVAATEGAEETVFTVPTPISLAAGHSASVPIIDAEFPAARISLATAGSAHPLAAIRLVNRSQNSLPAGVLTLFDPQSAAPYAGDARLGGLPAGETRLIPYAEDLRTGLEWFNEDSVAVTSLNAAAGVLNVDKRERQVTRLTLTGPANEPRHVLVQADKPEGGTLATGFAEPAEQTASAWRFAVDLKPGETGHLAFAVDQHARDTIALLDDEDAVAAVLNLQGVSEANRDALNRLTGLRSQQAAQTSERDRLTAQRDALDADEARLRANLGAVTAGDALRGRLVRQLDADETKHAQLDAAIDAADAASAKAHNALMAAVATLRL